MAKQDLGKKVWYDPDQKGYIGLDVTKDIPSQAIQTIGNTKLLPKSEYHCSLVAVRRYIDNRDKEQLIANAIKDYLQTHTLRYIKLDNKRYVCRKDDRMTIIAPVKIEGIKELQAFIKTFIHEYQPPFSHITILKSETTELGIGVNSVEELVQYCKKMAY